MAAFHRQRVLPLMTQQQCLFEMTLGEPIDGIRLSAVALSNEEVLRRGMRDVRVSPPPVPEDVERRAANRAHAEAYKERKDAKEAKRKRKSLERNELEKCRRQQRHDGLPEEPSLSPLSMDSSSDDDESEVGRGPLDHLPDVREMAPGVSVSGPVSLGRGGEGASGLAIACPRAEADMPKTRASGKRAVSPMGSTMEVGRAIVRATQLPPQRVEEVLEPVKGRPVSADTGAVPPPPPPPLLRTRDAVWKLLCPRSRADPKEPVAQGEAIKAATKQAGEEAPTSHEAEAHESDEAEAPSVAEATEGEAEVAEAGASRASEAEVTDTGAPRTTEAEVVEAGAPETTEVEAAEAGLGAAKPAA
ncbi:uncharacterized protein [Miscanthus floridulus]|uniref:uncharacterized protein n=1 Tax=Miscanthus floridulus TaxID=154761 RepID=UPI00345AB0D4